MTSRQYYYGHIFADPQKLDVVYTFSSKSFYKSTDGGKTWDGRVQTPHSDYHDLWIDPHDDQRMINGNDGGATVTFDGGKSWTSEMNQPTGQFYTVRADSGFPYRVYGAQQDDTTVSISNDSSAGGRGGLAAGGAPFEEVGGGESGYVVPDLQDPNIVYAGAYLGLADALRPQAPASPATLPSGRIIRRAHRVAERNIASNGRFRSPKRPLSPARSTPAATSYSSRPIRDRAGRRSAPTSRAMIRRDENGGRLEDVYCTVFTIAPSPKDKNTSGPARMTA